MELREAKVYVPVTWLSTNNIQNGQTKNLPERARSESTQVLGIVCGLASDVWKIFCHILRELGVQDAAPASGLSSHPSRCS